ncbi:hypothetical protein [Bradyrhizobium sp.]|uniref:hypothetical protein n=1 Tax=Bradyrhizobium sp. TaxID=376 RepID=UPI003C26E700
MHRGKVKRDEVLDNELIQNAALRRGQAEHLERFPLLDRQIAVEFRVHFGSDIQECLVGVLQGQDEQLATTMRRDFDHGTAFLDRGGILPTGNATVTSACQ